MRIIAVIETIEVAEELVVVPKQSFEVCLSECRYDLGLLHWGLLGKDEKGIFVLLNRFNCSDAAIYVYESLL